MQQAIPFTPTAEDYKDFNGDDEPELWTTIDHETGEIVDDRTAMVQLNQDWAALANVRTAAEALDLSNRAAAVQYYLKRSGAELALQNSAAKLNVFSLHKASILTKDMPERRGQHKKGKDTLFDPAPTLADLGIDKNEAKRLHALAELDESEVITYVEDVTEKGKEITRAGVVKLGKAKTLARKRDEHDAQAQAAPIKPSVAQASWSEWLPEQPDCDLLITDPPYSTDVNNIHAFAAEWLPLALATVRSTGRAYVCIGAYPEELHAYLNADRAGMTLAQVLVWTYRNTLGPTPKEDYKLNWQAILYFRGVDAPPLDCPTLNEQWSVQDVNAPDGRLGNRYHAWQKPDELAERLIRHSTKPGDLILDPFAGTGTFLLAATRLGREARGCDIDEKMIALALQRGCDSAS